MIRLFKYDDSAVAFLIRAFKEVGEKFYSLKSAAFIEILMIPHPFHAQVKIRKFEVILPVNKVHKVGEELFLTLNV